MTVKIAVITAPVQEEDEILNLSHQGTMCSLKHVRIFPPYVSLFTVQSIRHRARCPDGNETGFHQPSLCHICVPMPEPTVSYSWLTQIKIPFYCTVLVSLCGSDTMDLGSKPLGVSELLNSDHAL